MSAHRVLASLLVVTAGLSESRAADPWTKVPPLSTSGYQSDGFETKVKAARAAVQSDRDRQETINKELTDKAKSMDPMELVSRQQQYMMDHPEEAMKLMQRNVQLGETLAANSAENVEELLALQRELEEIDARYKTALDRALAPVKAKFADLDVRAMKDPHLTEAGPFYKPWAIAEWNTLAVQENAAYERLAADWWGAAGAYHGWLKRYRARLVERIPQGEEAENVGAGFMVQMVGSPNASFRPIASLHAVDTYLDWVGKVFERRRAEPIKPRTI